MATQSIPYSLRRNEAVRPGLVRILNSMGRDVRELSEKPEGDLEKSIHDIRTLIKRLRAYLWFLRPTTGKIFYKQGNACLRKAARRLSKTRDLHAVASALTKAAVPATNEVHLQALVEVSQAFAQTVAAQKKDKNLRKLEKVADTVIQVMLKIVIVLERNAEDVPSPRHRLKKIFKLTRKAVKKTLRKKDPLFVHEWRKKTKRLFYILQLTAQVPGMGMSDCLRQVDKLQEKLGDFQDNTVAKDHLCFQSPHIEEALVRRTIHLLRKNQKILLKEAHHCWDAVVEKI